MRMPAWRRAAAFSLLAGALCAGTAAAQSITTVAGNGDTSPSGDGGPALDAGLDVVTDVARDGNGNIFLVESWSHKIRKISPNGVISHFAGTGQPVFVSDTETNVGDGGPATAAAISPRSIAADAAGNVYFTDLQHHRVRKITPAGVISTIAGRGEFGYTGDGGNALLARLADMRGIAVDASGAVYVSVGQAIRKISGGIITRFAGSNIDFDFAGDGGPATSAYLHDPAGLAVDAAGNVFVADSDNGRVRRIGTNGIITTVMGTRAVGTGPWGWPWDFYASRLHLEVVTDVAVDSKGYVYAAVGDTWIRKVSPAGWVGNAGGFRCPDDSCGVSQIPAMIPDGGDVFQAYFSGITSLEMEPGDSLLVASDHWRVRRISPTGPAVPPVAADVLKPYVALPIDGNANSVGIGDFDGDGRNDAVVVTSGSFQARPDDFKVLLYRQQPDGSLGAPTKAGYSAPLSSWSPSLIVADFNHDGRKDIVVGRLQGLTVFLGNAGGNLVAQNIETPLMFASFGYSIIATDVDDDGHLDIVTSARNDNQAWSGLWTFRGLGNGSFQAGSFTVYDKAFSNQVVRNLLAADFDADGDEDLMASGSGSNQRAVVLLHQGQGNYTMGPTFPVGQTTVQVAGDADDDARDDYLQIPANVLDLYRQDANRRFDAPRRFRGERMGEAVLLRDMNKDGRRDVLQLELGWALFYHQRNAAGYEVVRKYPLPFGNFASVQGMAVGALDADACDDVLVAGETEGLLVFRGQNCAAPSALRDIDGDGRDELAWAKADGTLELWPGGQRSAAVALRPGVGWSLAALADFSGDGRADVLWRHCSNGALMQTSGYAPVDAAATRAGPGRDWRLAASADFDGDGHADLLWQHASGLTERWPGGDARLRQRGARLASGWSVVASGDFDGDGRADLFWRHDPTGANLLWRAGGLAGAQRITAITDRDWTVVASGDSDGDGRADLFWRHRRDGRNALWPAADYARRRSLATMADGAWHVVGMDDEDGDRRADLRWQHASGLGLLWKRADPSLAMDVAPVPRGVQPARGAVDACRAPAIATPAAARAPAARAFTRGRLD